MALQRINSTRAATPLHIVSSRPNLRGESLSRPAGPATEAAPSPTMGQRTPDVLVAVFVVRPDGKFLVGTTREAPATLALPFVGLRAFETFEQAALRCVPTNTTVAVPAARVAFLSTIETVPTARLHNRGRHTITFFMGVWVGATVVPADRSGAACSMWEWRTWRDLDGKVQVTPIDDPLQQLKWHYASENTTPVQQMIERIGECETKKEKAARLAAEKAAAKEAIKDVKARQAAAKASKKLQQQEVKAQEVQAKRQRKEAKRDSILRAQNADISSDTRGESSLEDDNTDVLERIARTQTLRAEEEASKKKCIVM